MDKIQEARLIITETEQKLRKLIEQGLADQRYGDVAAIASLAEGLSKLRENRSSIASKPHTPAGSGIQPSTQLKTSTKQGKSSINSKTSSNGKSGGSRKNYPRFERDHDRLIKVGWSKKTKKEYEHRAPKEVVIAFVQHLVSNVGVRELFEVEQILPVHDSSGADIPAYQVYLSLAWLRDAGVINKKGRDGYVLMTANLNENDFDAIWAALPVQTMN